MISNKWVTVINWAAAALVALLAILAFILSYASLQHLAATNGIKGWLSYIWPLLLDFAMITFALAILRSNLRQDKMSWYPWILTVAFAGLATAGNVFDVTTFKIPSWAVRATVKALAPIALALAFHLLMEMLKAEVRRNYETISLKDLAAQREGLAQEVAELGDRIGGLSAERDQLAATIADLRTAKSEGIGTFPYPIDAARDRAQVQAQTEKAQAITALLAFYSVRPNASFTEAGRHIGRSRQTVSNYLQELAEEGQVILSSNGSGRKVIVKPDAKGD